jgi:SAM-dependent methyltransferase
VPCPVCGASGAEPMARIDRRLKRLTTVLCGTCGVFYTNPMPTQAELDAYYRDTYRRDYQFARSGPGAKHVAKKEAEAARRYATLAGRMDLSTPRRVLDFGCGSGELVRHFAEQRHQAHGFEPGVGYAAHAAGAGSVEIRTGTWAGMDYAEGSFDAITCLHVLEHLREPVAALRAMARWLTPDGLLYLEVPDMQGYELKGFEHFHFAHVIGFSSDNLVLAGKNAGLGVIERLKGTSILFSKAAPEATIDLPATVARNRSEYGPGISLPAYLGHHIRRVTKRALR